MTPPELVADCQKRNRADRGRVAFARIESFDRRTKTKMPVRVAERSADICCYRNRHYSGKFRLSSDILAKSQY